MLNREFGCFVRSIDDKGEGEVLQVGASRFRLRDSAQARNWPFACDIQSELEEREHVFPSILVNKLAEDIDALVLWH